jgi:23S rRNA G2445 N2-methylase RlmL
MKYKLNVKRDVDTDEPGVYILNLPYGYRFDDEVIHTRGYDSMKEVRAAAKNDVISCDCAGCLRGE